MKTKFPERARQKAESRERLLTAARELFVTKGYDATKMDEIAERADLHVQTLYRHFSTKQTLAIAGDQMYLDQCRELINDPDREGNTFQFWRSWLGKSIDELVTAPNDERYRQHLIMRSGSQSLLGGMWAIQAEYEHLLTKSLAADFRLPLKGVSTPRLVAGMLLSGNRFVLTQYEYERSDLKADSLAVVDTVESMFSHLIKTAPD